MSFSVHSPPLCPRTHEDMGSQSGVLPVPITGNRSHSPEPEPADIIRFEELRSVTNVALFAMKGAIATFVLPADRP